MRYLIFSLDHINADVGDKINPDFICNSLQELRKYIVDNYVYSYVIDLGEEKENILKQEVNNDNYFDLLTLHMEKYKSSKLIPENYFTEIFQSLNDLTNTNKFIPTTLYKPKCGCEAYLVATNCKKDFYLSEYNAKFVYPEILTQEIKKPNINFIYNDKDFPKL